MIATATPADGTQVRDITTRAGVFNQAEADCLAALWQEYLSLGAATCGYNFMVARDGDRVLGYASYGPRDLTTGVFDLYWIAVDPMARRSGIGRELLAASEAAAREAGGRMIIAETSGMPHYQATRTFYRAMGYAVEATIRDFYRPGDDLYIFVKRF